MGVFHPSTQRHYRRLIYYLYIILLHVSVVRPSSGRKYIISWDYSTDSGSVNLGCLHHVVCVRSGDGVFHPSMQHHYRRLIYYLYIILLHVLVVGPSSGRKYINTQLTITMMLAIL
jgi:hypothetical protein